MFGAVAGEVGRLLAGDFAILVRYDQSDTLEVVGAWTSTGAPAPTPVGVRLPLGGRNVITLVWRTGRQARIDYDDAISGTIGQVATDWGLRSSVGVPVSVEGQAVGCHGGGVHPPGTFPGGHRDAASRVHRAGGNRDRERRGTGRGDRLAGADRGRRRPGAARRIERDLHDGAQQRLVTLALQLRAARAAVPPELGELGAELDRAAAGATGALDELREIARGIHPAILAKGGLSHALKTLARRSPIPVDLQVRADGQLPNQVEVSAYYVVAEALTNAARHSRASAVSVEVEVAGEILRVAVRDDGAGGADLTRGTGLVGLKDRVQALGGLIFLDSRPGAGTTLQAEFPLTATNDGVTSR